MAAAVAVAVAAQTPVMASAAKTTVMASAAAAERGKILEPMHKVIPRQA